MSSPGEWFVVPVAGEGGVELTVAAPVLCGTTGGVSTELYHLPGFYEPFNAISHMLATVVFMVLG